MLLVQASKRNTAKPRMTQSQNMIKNKYVTALIPEHGGNRPLCLSTTSPSCAYTSSWSHSPRACVSLNSCWRTLPGMIEDLRIVRGCLEGVHEMLVSLPFGVSAVQMRDHAEEPQRPPVDNHSGHRRQQLASDSRSYSTCSLHPDHHVRHPHHAVCENPCYIFSSCSIQKTRARPQSSVFCCLGGSCQASARYQVATMDEKA